MDLYLKLVVMVSVFLACGFGIALAKASHQREEAEGDALGQINPASSRMAATTLRTQVRSDVSSRFARRVAERGNQVAATATDGLGNLFCFHPEPRFNHDERGDWPIALAADCQSQGVVNGKDAA